MANWKTIDLATTGIGRDAWGKPKTIKDYSILHGLFTFNVPENMWKEIYNGVEVPIANASSIDGYLSLVSGAALNDITSLNSYRNPRYQPNRGHLYSSSIMFPLKNAIGNRRIGLFNSQNGVFFLLESGILYAVVRTTQGGVTTEDKHIIDATGVDLEKGNLFDIQFQWRGVGDYNFFINQKLVHKFNYKGTLSSLSISNPALPIGFECENLGDNVEIICGCVDVTTEGGDVERGVYGSIAIGNQSGQISISGYNQPIIAIRSKTLVGVKINTRDTLILLGSAYADQRAMMRIWKTRDFTAIIENDQSWQDYGDGHLEFIVNDVPNVATPMTFDTTKATSIFGSRIRIDETYSTSALFEGRTNIYITPGDMYIFTIHRETGGATFVGATVEFAEEI